MKKKLENFWEASDAGGGTKVSGKGTLHKTEAIKSSRETAWRLSLKTKTRERECYNCVKEGDGENTDGP